ncbi:hypothetical protein [Paenibacillus dendritiformis]|nr:hypothetical protein [Paenibacillus dendritiformis]CAH8770355.1 hypothetical protein H7S4_003090 [Paenibacillus dendritiformis]
MSGSRPIKCRPIGRRVVFASYSDQETALPLQHMHALIEAAASSSADPPS